MKAFLSTPVAPRDYTHLVGSSMDRRKLAKAKKISRKLDRAHLKAFFQKEAVSELHADMAEAVETARIQRETAYKELMQRMRDKSRTKKMKREAQRQAAAMRNIHASYGLRIEEDDMLTAERTAAYVVSGDERKLVASCG